MCFSSSCEQRGVICFLCSLEHHNNHDPILPFKPFVASFMNSTTVNEQTIKVVSQIDQELMNIQSKLSIVKRKCLDFGIIEDAFGKFWKATVL